MTMPKGFATMFFILFFALSVLIALPKPAHARSIKVGNGTAASCTEAAVQNALTLAGGEKHSVIQFRCGVEPVTIVVTATLAIPDNTTIDGEGLITLDGESGTESILRVDRDSAVTLRRLHIDRGGQEEGASLPMFGGGLFNEGTVTVEGCTFSGNFARSGGGIFNNGELTIRSSAFSGNLATRGPSFGGGIFNEGTLTVQDSTFEGNRAGLFGGGIFSRGPLAVRGSGFSYNSTVLWGGAIFAESTLTVADTQFFGNGTDYQGGTLMIGTIVVDPNYGFYQFTIATGTQTVSNSTITQSFSLKNATINSYGTLTITDSVISNNDGSYEGGGLQVTAGTASVKNTTFTANRAGLGGGAAISAYPGTLTTVQNSAINQNVGGGFAGSILVYPGGNFVIKNSTVTQNGGGGVSNLGTLEITDSIVAQNSSLNGGGISNAGTLVIKESTIADNTAVRVQAPGIDVGGLGGGILNQGSLAILGSTITRNTAGLDGGGIYTCCGGTLELRDTVVQGNTPNDIVP